MPTFSFQTSSPTKPVLLAPYLGNVNLQPNNKIQFSSWASLIDPEGGHKIET
jgi:hypothetical protein